MKFATEAIHSSYDCDEHNRAIMPPIYQNSMFAMHEIGEQIPYRYSRLANPTRKVLEDTMAALEHGAAGFAFASGMAGIDAVWRTFLRPGDTIAAVADIYGGAYDLLTEVYAAWGINVVFADLTDPQSLDTILAAQKVKMLWLETPSNPLLRITDLTGGVEPEPEKPTATDDAAADDRYIQHKYLLIALFSEQKKKSRANKREQAPSCLFCSLL